MLGGTRANLQLCCMACVPLVSKASLKQNGNHSCYPSLSEILQVQSNSRFFRYSSLTSETERKLPVQSASSVGNFSWSILAKWLRYIQSLLVVTRPIRCTMPYQCQTHI